MIPDDDIKELLRTTATGRLYHRESPVLEFKEQFNFGSLGDYLQDFAAFANNRGGHLVFGVRDAPREPVGLSKAAIQQFENIDPGRISAHLLETFSPSIDWDQGSVEVGGAVFGVIRIHEADEKPVVARRNAGSDIRNGEIYYRYGGALRRSDTPNSRGSLGSESSATIGLGGISSGESM